MEMTRPPRQPDTRRYGRRAVLSSVAGAGLLAAGCGSSRDAADPHRLVVAVAGHFIPQMKDIIAEYRKLNPDLTVELQTLPDDQSAWVQRLVTARLGGQLPDIVENVDVLINQLAESRVTEDLTPWFAKKGGLQEREFLPQFLHQYEPIAYPGQIHGIPVSADATVLFYNKALFHQAGADLPNGHWDWRDMYAASKKLTRTGQGKFYGMSMADPWQAIYNPVIHSYGGYVYDADKNAVGIASPAAIEAWKFLLRPYTDGTYAPYSVAAAGASAPTFETGKVALLIGVRANVPTIRAQLTDPWDVAPLPKWNHTRPVGGGSYGLSMTTTSQRKENAWRFLSWFYSERGGLKFVQRTYQAVPPTKAGVNSGLWRELDPPPANVAAFDEDAKAALLAPALPRRAQAVLDDSIKDATQKVVLHHVPVRTAFGAAATAVNEALDKGQE